MEYIIFITTLSLFDYLIYQFCKHKLDMDTFTSLVFILVSNIMFVPAYLTAIYQYLYN